MTEEVCGAYRPKEKHKYFSGRELEGSQWQLVLANETLVSEAQSLESPAGRSKCSDPHGGVFMNHGLINLGTS